jgi:hypothetical protein
MWIVRPIDKRPPEDQYRGGSGTVTSTRSGSVLIFTLR